MKIGFCANLRRDFPFDPDGPSDQSADWDIIDTISHVQSAIERLNHTVQLLEPAEILGCKVTHGIDAILSICEMTGGPFRESIVPTLCEFEKVPYFFSSPDCLHNTLDKNLANMLVQQCGVRVPKWINIEPNTDLEKSCITELTGPYIVKPTAEGSGMGMSDPKTLARTPVEAIERVRALQDMYGGDVLIQEFVGGREFTVGVIDTEAGSQVLCPIEISPQKPNNAFIYNYHTKENASDLVTFTPLESEFGLLREIQNASIKVHSKLKCRDVSRIDFRFDLRGQLNFIEINALPHFHPDIGDFCRSALAYGYDYDQMWQEIIAAVQRRYALHNDL